MTKINIILGSSRKNALGLNIFKFMKNNQQMYQKLTGAHFKFIDLNAYKLPFFYEAIPPMANQNRQLPHNEQNWLDDMQNADGYIFLTPEYNHSFPAVLKNALDYLAHQTTGKATFIVSYANNARAGQFGGLELSHVLSKLGAFVCPTTEMMNIRNAQDNFKANGDLIKTSETADYYNQKIATLMQKAAFYSQLFKNNPFEKEQINENINSSR
ncbi:NADPH-dependent FMN reductase [Apilactobacillus xinyiensis]|uniref:NADPH-dependent FMN reductase n=1 Tax=Apilactobacillus xinyiensis TaxID=2841032 RepID=UPI001C7D7092|nr:NAD(P)H-dependent oxidoreductase [Apilactobacillus xinyiensis]